MSTIERKVAPEPTIAYPEYPELQVEPGPDDGANLPYPPTARYDQRFEAPQP